MVQALKKLSYIDDVIAAAKTLPQPDAPPISLPEELADAEIELNRARTQMQENLRLRKEAEQRKNDLIMYLAHDLKTPLSSVIGYLTLLHDEGQISPELRERYLGIALEKAERLEDLINEFFEITRFNLSEITLQYSRIDLTRLLEQLTFEFILVFFTLYKLLWRKEISEPRTAANFKDVLGSLVVGFGICGISGLWIMLAEQLPSLQKSIEAMNAGAENIAGGNAFGTFMIAVIAAPVVEEILFRGIVLRSMRKFAPAWASILISSILFGVYHLNIVQAAYATLMGIAAGILYEKKRNLLFPILVHFANNLITMLQGFAPSEVNELISIFILIMIAPAGYVVCRSLRQGKRADSV